MVIYFENQFGRLRMGGGESTCEWKLTGVEGLGLTEKTFNTVVYPGQPGQKTLGVADGARTITVNGDINGTNHPIDYQLSNALKILNEPGWLVIRSGHKVRKIEAACGAFELGERNGPFQLFLAQFICDDPYFEGEKRIKVNIFGRENKIKTPFILPMVFTQRLTEKEVVNQGDVNAQPVFMIYGEALPEKQAAVTLEEETFEGLILLNKTTGQTIKLNYLLKPQQTVWIDIPNRKIYGQEPGGEKENLIQYITSDTFLSDFWLVPGVNQLEVVSSNIQIRATCEYANKYIEAVC